MVSDDILLKRDVENGDSALVRANAKSPLGTEFLHSDPLPEDQPMIHELREMVLEILDSAEKHPPLCFLQNLCKSQSRHPASTTFIVQIAAVPGNPPMAFS